MQEILDRAGEFWHEHWIRALMEFVFLTLSSIWGWFWMRKKWRGRNDPDVIHLEQVTFEKPDGKSDELAIMLVCDVAKQCTFKSIVSQAPARRLIYEAARRTTAFNQFLVFDPADKPYVMGIVRSQIEELFYPAAARRLHDPKSVVSVGGVFALTYVQAPAKRDRRLGVVIVRWDGLESLPPPNKVSGDIDCLRTLGMMNDDCSNGIPNAKFCFPVRMTFVR